MKNGRHVCSYRSYNPRIVYATLWEGIVTVILCHQEEKDLEWYRSMAVILGNRLTRNQECQLESRENGNRCVPVNSNRLYALIENTKADCIDLMMQVSTGN
jgi:hypothetical protein